MTAEIISFRGRQPKSASDDSARLQRALHELEAALAEQRAAVTAWRDSLAALRTTMCGLGDGLQRYHGALDQLQSEVAGLSGEAVQLEQWADSVLASAATRSCRS